MSSFSSQTWLIFCVTVCRESIVVSTLFTLFSEAVWISVTKCPMLAVRFCVSSASCLISSATTANPFPASPALAASMEAFSASRFVWEEIELIPAITLFI